MATPEHLVITGKVHVNFRIVTRGATLLAPSATTPVMSCDVSVQYTRYGDIPDDAILKIRLDESDPVIDSDNDGEYLFPAVSDGAHSVSVWYEDNVGSQIGSTNSTTFTVTSTLSSQNTKSTLTAITKALSASSNSKRKKYLSTAQQSLTLMANGGEQSPLSVKLNQTNIDKALSLAKKASKHLSQTSYLKQLRKLLLGMLK